MRNVDFEYLILNPSTKAQLLALQNSKPHALLFYGPDGVGKLTVALAWSANLTDEEFISVIKSDDGTAIGIETIRELYKNTRSRLRNHQIVIIDHAELMSIEAQNSLLKLLEEPRPNLTFILLAPEVGELLPTIISRLQPVKILPTESSQIAELIKQSRPNTTSAQLNQLLFIADGRIGTTMRLLHDDDFLNKQIELMQTAKKLITEGKYERLLRIQDLVKDRGIALEVLGAVSRMVCLQIAATTDQKWQKGADLLQDCQKNIKQNGNLRAQLLYLFTAF